MTIQLEKLVSTLELNADGFKSAIAASVVGVTAVVGAMTLASKMTFDWADDLDALGDSMDGDSKSMAALAYEARKSGVGVDALAKANNMLNKGLLDSKGKLDTVGKTLKKYGIDVKDVNGNTKDTVRITDEIAKKYAALNTVQERTNFLTDVYGKSGATLVDLFDTLNGDGGISEVTKKVEALGLAINPDRYEKFNRNLEELKLMGLSVAVAFTEKAMPSIEGFLSALTDFAKNPSISTLTGNLDNLVGKVLKGLGDDVDKWVRSGGPEELSNKVISWVDHLGDEERLKSKTEIAAQHLLRSLTKAVVSINWTGIASAMDEKLAESLRGQEWGKSGEAMGESFGGFIVQFFSPEGNKFEKSADSNWLIRLAAPGVYALFQFLHDTKFGQEIVNSVVSWFDGVEKGVDRALRPSANRIKAWAAETRNDIANWSADTVTKIQDWAATFEKTVDTKLRSIAKTFFNRALAWTQQMINGFTDGLPGLLESIQGLVDEINKILHGIISRFTVSGSVGSISGGWHPSSSTVTTPLGGLAGGLSPDERDERRNQSVLGINKSASMPDPVAWGRDAAKSFSIEASRLGLQFALKGV